MWDMGKREPSSQKFHQPKENKMAMYPCMKSNDKIVRSFVEGKRKTDKQDAIT